MRSPMSFNITDVGHLTSDADTGDDKLEAAARDSRRNIWDVAAHYTAAFKADIRDLNIREPSRWSVATDHIAEMIAFAEKIAPEHCYELDSGLYFDATTVPDYGRLSGNQDDEREGRIDPVSGKRHPQDFAIWRKSPPGEQRQMEWDSPWGKGAPRLAPRMLGDEPEVSRRALRHPHRRIDHREIHHPNEIAQNQAWCGCPRDSGFTGAHFWMHNNFLVERSGKMSKSSGGFTTLRTLVDAGVHPLAYRLMCLGAQYRSELEFGPGNLGAALTRLKRAGDRGGGAARARDGRRQPRPRPGSSASTKRCRTISTPPRRCPCSRSCSPRNRCRPTTGWRRSPISTRCSAWTWRISRARICACGGGGGDRRRRDRGPARRAPRRPRREGFRALRRDPRLARPRPGVEVMDGDPLGWDWKPRL